MPMADFTPLTSSSTRKAIGWEKLEATPGTSASASRIFSTSSSLVLAVVHSSRGLSVTMTSLLFTPFGIGGDVGAARLGNHVNDFGELFQNLFSAIFQVERLRQRDAGDAKRLHGNRAFIQRRQKLRADARHERERAGQCEHRRENHEPRMTHARLEQHKIDVLQPADVKRVVLVRHLLQERTCRASARTSAKESASRATQTKS